VVATLQDAGVPAVLAQLGDIYDSFEMRELEVVLRAVLAPRRHRLRQRAASTLLWGAKLGEVADAATAPGERSSAGDDWSEELLRLQEDWREQGFVPMCGRLLRRRKVRSRLLALDDGERRWTNLQHAIEILDRDATDEHLDTNALVRWISRQRGRGGDDERRQLRLERDAHAVQVLTIHKCKGLQFEVVLCPFLYGPVREPRKGELFVVPGAVLDRDEDLLWRAPEKTARQHGEALRISQVVEYENLAEDLRLLYVALTRARRRCVVWTGATGRDAPRNALSFLLFGRDHDGDSSLAAWWEEIRARAQEAWEDPVAAMERLCEESEGSWQLVGEGGGASAPLSGSDASEELEAAVFPAQRHLVAARVVSFSSWTRELSPPRAQDHLDPDEERPVEEAAPRDIFAFARGARAGLCLHEILERVGWTKDAGDARREVIGAILERYGLATPEAHATSIDPLLCVEAMLGRVSRLRRPDDGGEFASFSPGQRRAEWAFDAALGQRSRVGPSGLARIFREHARGDWVEEFARRVERLTSQRVQGILTGFVDLVFRDGDRWWVLDWKSNHLGNRLEDYGPAALRRSMLEHDYHLQSHLYLVALHRHLRRMVDDYDPARQLGGSVYVYLRGLSDDGVGGTYVDRPEPALIEALDRALDGEVGS
jgi:exodeoxyribonuclease V beta subunit